MNVILKKIKTAVFYVIVLIPAIIVSGIFLNIGVNVHRINNKIDYDGIQTEVEEYLSSDRGEASVSREGAGLIIGYEYRYSNRRRSDSVRRLEKFDPSAGEYVIYVFGSSPVVAKPPFLDGNFRTFSDILEERLNTAGPAKAYRVYNLGLSSTDSFAIKEIAEDVIGMNRPDLVVYYYGGGMDYESAYYAAGVKQRHYPLTVVPVDELSQAPFLEESGLWRSARRYAGWFNRTYLQTYLINFLQMTGLLRVEAEPFRRINGMILEDIEKNVKATATAAAKEGIPFVFVTNLSNLEARPFGVYKITEKYYEAGMAEDNIRRKFELLTKARDSELFTGDLGPKSGVYDIFMREGEDGTRGIYTMDLQGMMVDPWIGFDYAYFYDYGHMKPDLHRIIAEEIRRYLVEEGIVTSKQS